MCEKIASDFWHFFTKAPYGLVPLYRVPVCKKTADFSSAVFLLFLYIKIDPICTVDTYDRLSRTRLAFIPCEKTGWIIYCIL